MSGYRSQANHALYLARILIAGWRGDSERAIIPAIALAQAYEPAVCNQLASAYGWFLLEITRPDEAPAIPPRCCAELPEPPPGRVLPGEIREFEALEREGWLQDVLRDRRGMVARGRATGNLATAATGADAAECERWADRMQALFDRMSDSLDEY